MQGRINGELGDVADDGILAAVVNFSVGLAALCLIVFSRKGGRQAFASIRTHLRSGTLPWWALLGGLGGASFVAAQGLTVPALGVALFTVATVAGQTGMSLAVDKWGLGPSGALSVSALRVVAAVLATVAVFVASSGRDGGGDDNARALVILALLAGAAVAFQAAFNGRLSVATGRPTVAALVNFTVGLVVLLVIWAIQRNARGSIEGSLPSFWESPWMYCGGLMGLFFVVSAAWSVRALGVLLFSLVVIAGSLVGAVAVDLVAPTEGAAFTWTLVAGVLMTFLAVGLASVRRTPNRSWQDSVS